MKSLRLDDAVQNCASLEKQIETLEQRLTELERTYSEDFKNVLGENTQEYTNPSKEFRSANTNFFD